MINRALLGGLILGLVVWLAPLGAGAAEPPVKNLKELIGMALKFSPEVKASKSEVNLAQEQKNEAHGYRWPQIDATAMGGVIPKARLPLTPLVGGPGKELFYPDPKDKLHGVAIFGRMDFSVVQPLYTFGKIAFREEAAARNVKVKEAGVDSKKGEVIYQVSQAYYGLILSEQGKEAVKDARTYLSDTRERINRMLTINSPNVRETDRYRLASYEGALEKFSAQADEGSKVAYKALRALTNSEQDFRVPQELPNPTAPPGGLDYYVRQAVELRPEFTQLKEGLAARQLLVDAAKADRYPSFFLAVVGQLAGAGPGRKYNPDPYVIDYFNDNGALPFVGARWHFDFGILKAKIGQAQAELDQLRHSERTALMGIPVEVAQDYGKVQESYKGSVGMEKAYVNARRWLVTSFSNFDMGLGKMDDIFQAFERYGGFRGDYLQSLYDYNLAVAKLEKDTGAYRRNLPVEPLPSKAVKPAAATAPAK
jgi:outer membrane protein